MKAGRGGVEDRDHGSDGKPPRRATPPSSRPVSAPTPEAGPDSLAAPAPVPPPSPSSPADPPFFRALGAGALPLLLWALHFTACYTLAVIGCTDAEGRSTEALLPAATRTAVLAVSLLAMVAVAVLTGRACLRLRRERSGLLATVRLAAAVLALVGIAWTSVPALASACRAGNADSLAATPSGGVP